MGIDRVRSEIEHMRVQVGRQRREILQLQRAGISTASAELLLGRMHAKIDLVLSGSGSRRSRAARRKGACLAAGVGDGGACQTVTMRKPDSALCGPWKAVCPL
jgi:hypothetical protein